MDSDKNKLQTFEPRGGENFTSIELQRKKSGSFKKKCIWFWFRHPVQNFVVFSNVMSIYLRNKKFHDIENNDAFSRNDEIEKRHSDVSTSGQSRTGETIASL